MYGFATEFKPHNMAIMQSRILSLFIVRGLKIINLESNREINVEDYYNNKC